MEASLISGSDVLSRQLAQDDFTIFGLQRQFALQRPALDARWKELQKQAHPDKFAAQGSAAQRVAMQWSVRINEAYQRLRDPIKRATYLCELAGQDIGAHTNTAMPAAFLMQQMQWREALDEADTLGQVQALYDEVNESKKQSLVHLQAALDITHDTVQATSHVRALMFIDRFMQDVQNRLDDLENS